MIWINMEVIYISFLESIFARINKVNEIRFGLSYLLFDIILIYFFLYTTNEIFYLYFY